MKLHLPVKILRAVMACMGLAVYAGGGFTYAETLMAEGVKASNIMGSDRFFDVGKGYYLTWTGEYYYKNDDGQTVPAFDALNKLYKQRNSLSFLGDLSKRAKSSGDSLGERMENWGDDASTCWAQVSVNLVDYWQSYYGVFCKDSRGLQYGYTYDTQYLDEAGGTLSRKLSILTYDSFRNVGGNIVEYNNWYFKGEDSSYNSETGRGGFWKEYFSGATAPYTYTLVSTISDVRNALITQLGYTKNSAGKYEQTTKGQIAYLGMTPHNAGAGHAITCYGIELDSANNLKALYVTNSDDLAYRLMKLYVKTSNGNVFLYRDAACTKRWEYSDSSWYIDTVASIKTPQKLQDMLAEYEDPDNPLVWSGAEERNAWVLNETHKVAEELPEASDGWKVSVGSEAFDAWFDPERKVRFDDSASSGTVKVYGAGSVVEMQLANSGLDYVFSGSSNTLSADALKASGGGEATLTNLSLQATTATMSDYTLRLGSQSTMRGTSLTMRSGATLELAGGSVAITSITMGGGSTLAVTTSATLTGNISVSGACTFLLSPTANGSKNLTLNGNITGPNGSIALAFDATGLILDERYMVLSFGSSANANTSMFQSDKGDIEVVNRTMYITYNPYPKKYWTSGSNNWSSGAWSGKSESTHEARVYFMQGGTVTVTLQSAVTPYNVTVDNTGTYTFKGSGAISGQAAFIKKNTGTVKIQNANTYSGGTTIEEGCVEVGHASALGSGKISLSDGELKLNNYAVANDIEAGGGTLSQLGAYQGSLTVAGHVDLSGEAKAKKVVMESGSLSGGSISNAPVLVSGDAEIDSKLTGSSSVSVDSATATLSGSNSHTGGISLNNANLVLENAAALGKGSVTAQGESKISAKAGVRVALSSAITNQGSLTLSGAYDVSGMNMMHDAVSWLDVNNSTASGSGFKRDAYDYVRVVDGGRLTNIGAQFFHNGTALTLQDDGIVGSGGELDYSTYYIKGNHTAEVSKIATSSGGKLKNIEVSGGKLLVDARAAVKATGGRIELTSQRSELSGSVSNANVVVKAGTMGASLSGSSTLSVTGEATLSGASSHTGGSTIKNADLLVKNKAAFGAGDVSVQNSTLNCQNLAVGNQLTASYSELEGMSNYSGDVSLAGTIDLMGNLSADTLTLANDTVLVLDGGVLKADTLLVNGALTIQLGNNLYLDDVLLFESSDIHLSRPLDSVRLMSSSKKYAYELVQGAKGITLDVTRLAADLVWSNAKKAVWSMNGAYVWKDGSKSAAFTEGDNAAFRTGGSITIEGVVKPGEITVACDKSVTFKSNKKKPGQIAGDATLTKSGSGTLTIHDGNRNWNGEIIVREGGLKAAGSLSFGSSDITLAGTTDERSKKKVTLTLAGKGMNNDITIAAGKGAIIKGGKKYTGTLTMEGSLMKGSSLNVAKIAYLKGGKMDGTLSGAGKVQVSGKVTLGDRGKITTNALELTKGATFVVGSKGLSMNSKASAITLRDASTLQLGGKLSAYSLSMDGGTLKCTSGKAAAITLRGNAVLKNDAAMTMNGKLSAVNLSLTDSTLKLSNTKPQSITAKGNVTLNDSELIANGKLSAVNLSLTDSALKLSNTKPQSITAKGNITLNHSTLFANGKMTAKNLTLSNNSSIRLTASKPQSLSVKENLTLNSGSSITLNGKLSAGSLTMKSGSSITLSGSKPQTLAVKGAITLSSGSSIIMDFDFVKGKTYKLLTYKSYSGSKDFYSIFGVDEDCCTFSYTGKALTMKLTGNWNPKLDAAAAAPELIQEAETLPIVAAGAGTPDMSPLGDALAQSNWGIFMASQAFTDAVKGQRTASGYVAEGKAQAWVSALGGTTRMSSNASHSGSDINLSGAAVGMEAQSGAHSRVGLAIGRSFGKVNPMGFTRQRQDSTHVAAYGTWDKLLNEKTSVTLSWSAAYGTTETEFKGGEDSWTQDSLQLDARAAWNRALSDHTAMHVYGSLQYFASESATVGGSSTGSIQNLRAEAGVGISRNVGKSTLYAETGLYGDIVRHNPVAAMEGLRLHGLNPGKVGLHVNAGATYRLNERWNANASYSLDAAEHTTSHSINLGVGRQF